MLDWLLLCDGFAITCCNTRAECIAQARWRHLTDFIIVYTGE